VARVRQQASLADRYTCTSRGRVVGSRSPLSPLSARHPTRTMGPLQNGQNRFQQEKMGLPQRPTHFFKILIPTKSRRWIWKSVCDAEDIQTYAEPAYNSEIY